VRKVYSSKLLFKLSGQAAFELSPDFFARRDSRFSLA